MIRKLIAVAAVSGSLALGVVGVAGAATPASTGTPTAAQCATAEKVATGIQTLESAAATWVPQAQAREAKATTAGHTKLAARIGKRIARVQKLETRGTTLLGKISAKCGSASSAS
jgi:hypothetical protein